MDERKGRRDVGSGKIENLMVGCRIKILWQEWDLLILTDRMQNNFQNNRIWDENKIIEVTDVMRRTATLTR